MRNRFTSKEVVRRRHRHDQEEKDLIPCGCGGCRGAGGGWLREFYGWYALNVLELPPHVIALHLGHTDGGRLVREFYGHPDAALARARTREAFRSVAPVTQLRCVG